MNDLGDPASAHDSHSEPGAFRHYEPKQDD